jgi:hypothetical protein
MRGNSELQQMEADLAAQDASLISHSGAVAGADVVVLARGRVESLDRTHMVTCSPSPLACWCACTPALPATESCACLNRLPPPPALGCRGDASTAAPIEVTHLDDGAEGEYLVEITCQAGLGSSPASFWGFEVAPRAHALGEGEGVVLTATHDSFPDTVSIGMLLESIDGEYLADASAVEA